MKDILGVAPSQDASDTKIIPVGDPYKPSFPTVTGRGKWVFPTNSGKPPQIIHFNRVWNHEIFTIHFGGFSPYFWKHPYQQDSREKI